MNDKMQLGFNAAGTEKTFEKMLRQTIEQSNRDCTFFTYLEVGMAEGTTLIAVADLLQEMRQQAAWSAIGLDIDGGPFLNLNKFLAQTAGTKGFNVNIQRSHPESIIRFPSEHTDEAICIGLLNPGEAVDEFIGPLGDYDSSIDFCVIDGCHGAPCVERDFLAIGKAIKPGGIVAFHDAMLEDQGGEPGTNGWQQHCGTGINVIAALKKLDLDQYIGSPTNENPTRRPGWCWICNAPGDKSANPPGNGFVFFRKV